MRAPKLRTISEFSEQEIILPSGPFQGRRFKLDRHPAARLWFAELDSGRWRRHFITGPNQDGKSLMGFVIPTMHKLFEKKETVILGVPSLDLANDKWKIDIKPTIMASQYASLLPSTGSGSKDGESILFSFGNGVHLRFMTAGGDDQSRASFTAPNLIVTETNGFDEIGGSSQEGSKFAQLCRRLLAFGNRSSIIAECSVAGEKGITWQEFIQGSHSRIAIPCPHCFKYVTPERENLVGWQTAETKLQAVRGTRICCPSCGVQWENNERIEANRRAVLVHKGQEVADDGTIAGPMPDTDTLGFRWTVVNTILDTERLSLVGGVEWAAQRASDPDAAEKDVCQSQWALPSKPSKIDLSQLDHLAIMRRVLPKSRRGVCPDDTQCVTVACDVGKWLCHWTATAWRPNATPHVFDYGRLEVPSADMSVEQAIITALRDWRDEVVNTGWPCGDKNIKAALRFVDCGDWQDTILAFIAESGEGWFGTKGFGLGQRRAGRVKRDTGSAVIGTGDKYNIVRLPGGAVIIEVNADHWKSWLHSRLHTPMNQPGAFTLFDSLDHLSFAKHLTAEKQFEDFSPEDGTVIRWEAVSRNNHWFDSTTLTCVAGHAAGIRLLSDTLPPPQVAPTTNPENLSTSDWLARGRGKW